MNNLEQQLIEKLSEEEQQSSISLNCLEPFFFEYLKQNPKNSLIIKHLFKKEHILNIIQMDLPEETKIEIFNKCDDYFYSVEEFKLLTDFFIKSSHQLSIKFSSYIRNTTLNHLITNIVDNNPKDIIDLYRPSIKQLFDLMTEINIRNYFILYPEDIQEYLLKISTENLMFLPVEYIQDLFTEEVFFQCMKQETHMLLAIYYVKIKSSTEEFIKKLKQIKPKIFEFYLYDSILKYRGILK